MPHPEPAAARDRDRDDRKSAQLAERNTRLDAGAERVRSFEVAREILRNASVLQHGAGAASIDVGNPDHVPVFHLDGEEHRKRRSAIEKFFTPSAVTTRYRPLMERTTDELLARVRASGTAKLDDAAFELAVAFAAEIVGLTESDRRPMAKRIAGLLEASFASRTERGPKRLVNLVLSVYRGYGFLAKDVRPAVRARTAHRRDDVISQTIDKGYAERAIMVECMTYATAGMVTTREFIGGIRWVHAPEMTWHRMLSGYVLRGAVVACDRA